ncbi:MAG: hypothetical protein KF722_17705 [Nitrospira sp.]|nr:hypothetical protein [Nitrospira sp.]
MQAFVLISMISVLMAGAHVTAQAPSKWIKGAPFPEPSEELVGGSVGGKFYVFGGLGPGWIPQGLVYEYDPSTNSWSELLMMPMPRHGSAGAVAGDRLHLASGDIQSAGITGMRVVTDSHDIFEFGD